jgi:hypothetical protein
MMLIMTEAQAGITSAFYAHTFKNKFWKTHENRLPVILIQRFGKRESFRTFVR